MYLHEFQAKRLLSSFGIPTPVSILATEPVDCIKAFDAFGPIVIKAQIHAGGRGKAGGVRIAKTDSEAFQIGTELLGSRLVTNQTTEVGLPVNKLLCEPVASIKAEFYLSFLLDRQAPGVRIIFSPSGGVDIESQSRNSPNSVRSVTIHPLVGITVPVLSRLLNGFNFSQRVAQQLVDVINKSYSLFIAKDLSLLEFNPLAVLEDEFLVALDCKINVDDNALFRHPDLRILEDYSQLDSVELRARRKGLSYIRLSGNIGCMVNGAGLAMATMDAIKMHGGEPANFLDVGGGVSEEGLNEAMNLLLEDDNVAAVFINIFGGIVKCDLVATSIVTGFRNSARRKPTVIRLLGTNSELASNILSNTEFQFRIVKTIDEGAKSVIDLVR